MHIFHLVERMWGLNQNQISVYLGVTPSTISRLKSGKQSKFERSFNELYSKLFDPTNPQSPASGKDSIELLKGLKEEIKDAGWSDLTKGLKDDEYEKFVFSLFRLANENRSKLAVTPNKRNKKKGNKTQPERMLDLCRQSFDSFRIEDLIDCNPANSIESYLIQDAFTVVKRFRQKHENKDSPDKQREIYQTIVRFADVLLDYLKFLKSASGNINILYEGYKPLNDYDIEFAEEANRYRQQLNSLYQPIKVEIEKDNNEYIEQRRTAGKEAWDKSIQEGF